jgi:hypothetical protein
MRLLGTVALLGSLLSIGNVQAQNASDRGGAADSAPRVGSGQGVARPQPAPRKAEKWYGTSRTDALTESAPEGRRPTSELLRAASERQEPESIEPPAPPKAVAPPSVPSVPLVAPAPSVEFAAKEPTAEELRGIKIGASEKDVLTALGMPTSRIIVPDDDGHLRKTYQYWAKGSPVGTVRLDNGYVVKVEVRQR